MVAKIDVRIAPFSTIIWDDKLVKPNATAVIDTFGYTAITLYLQADKKAEIILEAVSRDSVSWRRVYESLFIFYLPDYVFLNLDETLKNRAALRYRYFKIRLVAEEEVKITAELTSKAMHTPKIGLGMYGLPNWNKQDPDKQTEIIREFTRTVIPGITILPPLITIEAAPTLDEEILDKLKLIQMYLYNSQRQRLTEIRNQLANAEDWEHNHMDIEDTGHPKQLLSYEIPDGCSLVIKAKSANTAAVYVGKSKADVLDTDKRIPLLKKEATGFNVTNADLVWLDAAVANEGVLYWCELKK